MIGIISNEKGFTLIEMITTVAILAIVVAIAITTGLKSRTDTTALNAQTNRLIADLRLLQTKAAAQNDGDLSFNIISSTKYQMETITGSVTLERGVQISATQPNFSSFTFKPDGTRSGIGDYEITLSVNGESKTIKITQQGMVELIQSP